MPEYKFGVCIIIFLLLICSFSGCMYFDNTNFSLISSVVSDDDGFPSLHLSFDTSDKVTVKISNPFGTNIFSDDYYSGSHEIDIHLADYRKAPFSGGYQLRAFDKYDRNIYENELFFSKAELEILDLSSYWWQGDNSDDYSLVGLELSLRNKGGLPAYPENIIIETDDSSFSSLFLPDVVLPNNANHLQSYIKIDNIDVEGITSDIIIRNYDEMIIAQSEEILVPDEEVSTLEFSWKSKKYEFEIPYPQFLYDYHSGFERRAINDYSFYVFDIYDDGYIELISDKLQDIASTDDTVELINFIASYVQDLTYAEDDPNDLSCEYPRYPVEMIVDRRGDCEDKAILLASLLDNIGQDVCLLRLPKHMAVGVKVEEELSGYDYFIDDYYYLEATSSNSVLGFIPKDYRDLTNITIYPISDRPLLTHSWKNATLFTSGDGNKFVKMKILVENIGRSEALNVEVRALVDITYGSLRIESEIIPILNANEKAEVDLEISIPDSFSAKLKTQLYLDTEMVDEKESIYSIT